MALTLQQQFDLANEQAFVNRCALAMAGYASSVMAEDQSAMTGADYNSQSEAAARTGLAQQVIRDAQGAAKSRRWFFAAKAAALTWSSGTAAEFAATITDSQYNGFVSANWSVLAGWRVKDTA